MALSEAEKDWLEERKNICNRCVKSSWCRTGEKHGYNTESCRFWELKVPNKSILLGSLTEDFRDAAEFEARVAVLLAKSICFVCPNNKGGGCSTKNNSSDRACIEACRMRHARLAAEAEMDKAANKN